MNRMNTFLTDIRSFLRSSRIWAAFIVGSLFFMRPLYDVWRSGANTLYSPMMLLSLPLAISDFTPFAPIFCAIPYATSFSDDYKSGYLRSIVIRIGAKRYSWVRTATVAFSGALVMMLIFSLTILVCVVGARLPNTAEEVDFMKNTIWGRMDLLLRFGGLLTYIGRIALAFLFGAIWSLVSLGISTWIPNRYVTLIAPFVLYQALWTLLADYPFNPLYLLRADNAKIPSLLFVLFHLALWILVWALISYTGIKRRCRHV